MKLNILTFIDKIVILIHTGRNDIENWHCYIKKSHETYDSPHINMFTVQRTQSAPVRVTLPQELESLITDGDKMVIEQVVRNPTLRQTMSDVCDFSKRAVEAAINKSVVDRFLNLGITAFGTKVKDAKTYIMDFLRRHPELRAQSADKCFTKIVYYFEFCTKNNLPLD